MGHIFPFHRTCVVDLLAISCGFSCQLCLFCNGVFCSIKVIAASLLLGEWKVQQRE